MIYEITMPKLGLTMEKGTIVRWSAEIGSFIHKGDPLLEIETDKSVVEVESPFTGYFRIILVAEKNTVNVGILIGYISDDVDEELPEKAQVFEAKELSPSSIKDSDSQGVKIDQEYQAIINSLLVHDSEKVKSSPKARKIAEKHAVNLRNIRGSGPGGRIVAADIEKFISSRDEIAVGGGIDSIQGLVKVESVSTMRSIIASRMLESTSNIPQYFVSVEVDMLRSLNYLNSVSSEIKQRCFVKPTLTDIITIVTAKALMKFELVNAYFIHEGDSMKIQYNSSINIGLAVDVPNGLVVPVLKSLEKKDLCYIVSKRSEMVEQARNGRLNPEDMMGGTFTISNMGSIGIDIFSAIINPPESAILAVGSLSKKPVIIEDAIAIRPVMNLTLTADHRLLDGAVAGRFLRYLADLLEKAEID